MSVLTDQLAINYRPPGPVAKAFLESRAFVRGIRGPFGSGKSTLCAVDIIDRAITQRLSTDGKRRSRFAIVRQTYPELKTTTIKTWNEIVSPQIGHWVEQGPPTHTLQADDLDCEVMFLALDSPADVKKLLSMDLTGAWINEAREVPKAVIDGLTARVGRYPSQAQGGCSWAGVTMDTNSPDSDHWWYVLAERDASTEFGRQMLTSTETAEEELRRMGLLADDQPLFQFFAQPSGLSAEAENVQNLRPGYYIMLMAGKSEQWTKVYVHGEYGFVQDGRAVYPEYVDSLHCKPFELMRGIPLHVGIDFGLTPAAIIGQRLMMGAWRWRYEIVAERLGAKRFAELELGPKLRELEHRGFKIESITGDPAGEAAAQTDESTVFMILSAAGVKALPAHSNDFTLRREAVAVALSRIIDGEPGFLIHPECAITRRGMGGRYAFKRVQVAGDARYQDKPDKNRWSHPCEAGQYMHLGAGEGRALVRPTITKPRQRTALM